MNALQKLLTTTTLLSTVLACERYSSPTAPEASAQQVYVKTEVISTEHGTIVINHDIISATHNEATKDAIITGIQNAYDIFAHSTGSANGPVYEPRAQNVTVDGLEFFLRGTEHTEGNFRGYAEGRYDGSNIECGMTGSLSNVLFWFKTCAEHQTIHHIARALGTTRWYDAHHANTDGGSINVRGENSPPASFFGITNPLCETSRPQ